MPIADPVQRRAYGRAWVRARRLAWLAGRSCVRCTATDRLQIDHVEPSQKTSHRIWTWAPARRNAELAKCQVLCYRCHLRKTAEERRTPLVHGTHDGYAHKGCRCVLCRRAHAESNALYRSLARRRAHARLVGGDERGGSVEQLARVSGDGLLLADESKVRG